MAGRVGPHTDTGHAAITAELVRVTLTRCDGDAAPELVAPLIDGVRR